jgi:hypothetical protein
VDSFTGISGQHQAERLDNLPGIRIEEFAEDAEVEFWATPFPPPQPAKMNPIIPKAANINEHFARILFI